MCVTSVCECACVCVRVTCVCVSVSEEKRRSGSVLGGGARDGQSVGS